MGHKEQNETNADHLKTTNLTTSKVNLSSIVIIKTYISFD